MTDRLRLARAQRLAATDVAAVLKAGRVTRSARLSVYLRLNSLPYSRLALIVPKRLAPKAVTRNRVRRLAREAFRLQQRRLDGSDCVVRLVKPAAEPPLTREEIETLLLRSVSADGQ